MVDVSPLFIKTDGLDGAVVSLPVVAVDSSPLSPCPQPDSARREKIPIIKMIDKKKDFLEVFKMTD